MINVGDVFTVAGFYSQVPNPNRRWFQAWKPKIIDGSELQTFTVTAIGANSLVYPDEIEGLRA